MFYFVQGFQFTRGLESKLSRQVMLPSRQFNKTTNIDIQFQLQCNRVKGISFHPTLPWILISFHTGGIEIWDYEAKRKEFQFDGHDGPVRAVNFHAELPLFASGGDDYAIRVWNYEEKNCDIVLLGHLDYIRAVKFHHQYSLLASCSDDQTIRFWDVFERKCISIVAWHNHYVMGVSFHPTEDLIVSCSLDQTVRVWNFSGLKRPDGSFEGEEGGSTCCKTQPAVVVKFILQGHERGVNWAIFHPTDPSLVISGADDRMIKVWKCNDSRVSSRYGLLYVLPDIILSSLKFRPGK
jgi:coatomer protein complex subunit alpha (xenin)